MKKIIPLVLLLAAVIGIFVFSVSYRSRLQTQQNIAAEDTTYHTETDNTITEADIIAENEEAGCKLYFKNNTATLEYSGAKLEFNNWARAIAVKVPELYYNDFDDDGTKELIVRIVDSYSDVTGENEYSYTLYLITPEDKDGETVLTYKTAQASTWKNVFNNLVKFEVTQLKECKKFLQFAMNDSDKDINYDEKTGITDNKYVSYAQADCSDKKEFYTISKYSRGLGIYNIHEDGTITLDVQVIINYEEAAGDYHIGNIHCDMMIQDGVFMVKPKTISFAVLDKYKITDPRDIADGSWSYEYSNLSTAPSDNAVIKNISCSFTLLNGGTRGSGYLGNMADDVKYIDSIEFSESEVVLKAKSGCSFDSEQLENGKFSVKINNNQDISYTAKINDDELIINFDKTYDKADLSTAEISYGE